ncbi:Ankyrin repeats (3 copies) family protein [Aspergillus niger]|uniref:Arginine N-methyltransferase 2 n=1 Tax=Aspergillus niger TaxID=5061 RepID=A0A505I349_ASPNG|nr:Ankyrin repeats (3 copies) family protein [Aspergillus niger]
MADADPMITFTQDPNMALNLDLNIQEILLAASTHNIPLLRRLIRENQTPGNPANVKDPETGFSPLHAAIAACEESNEEGEKQTNGVDTTNAGEEGGASAGVVETVKFLLGEGAIWNDLDLNDETPGCIARRLGLMEVYDMIVDAGSAVVEGPSVTQPRYLDSNLTFTNDRLLDSDQNGVMMSWESTIMEKSAAKLLPTPGLRVMNIGHGMGIVDTFLQSHGPSEHHIVEAHPEVVAEMKRKGWDQKPGVRIHEGRWQDVLPALVGEGVVVDAIYYDTFAESYSDFREFFSEQVIGILEQDGENGSGRWGFFNGMGADRQISYDVYQKVVEMDLFEAGFDVEWEELEVPALEGEWEGVRRPYWRIEKYRLPVCKFMD